MVGERKDRKRRRVRWAESEKQLRGNVSGTRQPSQLTNSDGERDK